MKFVLILLFFVQMNLRTKKFDHQGTGLAQDKLNKQEIKKCEVKEECRQCTFEELKIISECEETGYKSVSLCTYTDGEQDPIIESCNTNRKINSVYYLLFAALICAVASYRVRKSYLLFRLESTCGKLTILKKT
jgi:hypothetical protein